MRTMRCVYRWWNYLYNHKSERLFDVTKQQRTN